jgi:hypothetical protein
MRVASIVLPVPGGPGEEDRMRACRSDLQRAPRLRLAAHVGEIGIARRHRFARLCVGRDRGLPMQVRNHVEQRPRRKDGRALRERRFSRHRLRKHERASLAMRTVRHRERAANRAQLAGERELSRELQLVELLRRHLPRCRKDADCDRQVEASAFFRQVRRCEVHGDAAAWRVEARVGERGAHAIARLADFLFRKADDVGARQPAAHMHLHAHEGRIEAGEGAAVNDRKGHARTTDGPKNG